MNNIVPKLQKMPRQPNFFYSQPSTLQKKALAKFYLCTTFDLSFMIRSVAPTRSLTFYPYSVTKIGNRNLKMSKIWEKMENPVPVEREPKQQGKLWGPPTHKYETHIMGLGRELFFWPSPLMPITKSHVD